MHRFIADDWPAWLWLRIAPLSVPAAICWYLEPLPWLLESWYHPPLFAWVLIIAWALGWFGAILAGAPILGTI